MLETFSDRDADGNSNLDNEFRHSFGSKFRVQQQEIASTKVYDFRLRWRLNCFLPTNISFFYIDDV